MKKEKNFLTLVLIQLIANYFIKLHTILLHILFMIYFKINYKIPVKNTNDHNNNKYLKKRLCYLFL